MNQQPGTSDTAEKAKRLFDIKRELFEWSQSLVTAIVGLVLVFAFLINIFTVYGPSMMQTLHDGEMMLISRLFYTPERGDIIIFAKAGLKVLDEEAGRQSPYVKRVVGVEGDTVRIDYEQQTVHVNGDLLFEPYVWEAMQRLSATAVVEVTVEPGHVFVMGDNRNNSSDSRDPAVGQIDTRFILGKLLLRLTPLSKLGFVR